MKWGCVRERWQVIYLGVGVYMAFVRLPTPKKKHFEPPPPPMTAGEGFGGRWTNACGPGAYIPLEEICSREREREIFVPVAGGKGAGGRATAPIGDRVGG